MKKLFEKQWIWSFVAALSVWLATIGVTGGASTVGLSQAALTFAAFSVLVGIGQMFVITLGPGNIDLSVPATMTLSGTVALKYMDGGQIDGQAVSVELTLPRTTTSSLSGSGMAGGGRGGRSPPPRRASPRRR